MSGVQPTVFRGSDLVGRVVVDASTGDDVAEIRAVVLGANNGAITGFTLRRRGAFGRRLRSVLPIDAVIGIGTGAVMIADIGVIVDRDDTPDDMRAAESTGVVRDEVVTVSGRSLGAVRDVVVLGGPAPQIVGVEVDGGPAAGRFVLLGGPIAVSGRALVVPDAVEQHITSDLTGLTATIATIERGTS